MVLNKVWKTRRDGVKQRYSTGRRIGKGETPQQRPTPAVATPLDVTWRRVEQLQEQGISRRDAVSQWEGERRTAGLSNIFDGTTLTHDSHLRPGYNPEEYQRAMDALYASAPSNPPPVTVEESVILNFRRTLPHVAK